MLHFLLTLIALQASPPDATLEPHGGCVLSYGQVPVLAGDSLILMDSRWKVVDRAKLAAAKLTRKGDTTQARYRSALITLTKTVSNHSDHVEARWDFEMKPDPRGRHIELCIGIRPEVLAELKPTGKTHGVLQSQEELKLESFLGSFVLDVRGSTSAWNLDDLRKVEWSKAMRLRFAPRYDPAKGCKATAILRVSASPTASSAFAALPVAAAGNRGLSDDVENDGKGGWTDQGPNDLHVFGPGRHAFLGVPFDVGEKVIVLRGKERPAFPVDAAPISIKRNIARMYFLHLTAWSAKWREPVAHYTLTYADGKTVSVPVRYGVDVNDWWGASAPLEARLVWSGDNGQAQVGMFLMRWTNPRPDVQIRDVKVSSTNSGAVPVLLAATGVATGALSAEQLALLDKAYAARSEPEVSTDGWVKAPIAWRDGIEPESALDLSFLNHRPAGKYGFLRVTDGHFTFERANGKPVRFWGTNAALHGPFPPKNLAPGIALCLARQGVNMVRMHLYAVYEHTMIAEDGSLYAEGLDKFDLLIAELKKVGIYTYMDLNDGMFYDRLLGKKLPAGAAQLKMASLFNRDLIDAQKKLARSLFTHKNPHTGMRLCDDPAVALYEITNENSMTSNWGNLRTRLPEPYFKELAQLWEAWLKAQGKPPRPLDANLGDTDADTRRFGAELQKRYLDEMYDFLRSLGVKAPICGTNITFTLGDLWASERMDYMNDHAYWDHPNVRARPITYSNRAALRSAACSLPMVPHFARAKVRGKPVVASEWNYCFPNDFRCEGLPTMAAYAAYQDWDGLFFYCATGSFDGGRWARFTDTPGILVHSQQTDPATWGLSQLCALMFRRGDVRVGGRVVTLSYDAERMWENSSLLKQAPFLPALARVETVLRPPPADDWFMSQPQSMRSAELYAAALAHMGNAASSDTLVVTDTREIRRDAAAGILTVDTALTQLAAGFLSAVERVKLHDTEIECMTRFATIGVTSLDGTALRDSRRMLLVAVANARNADTRVEARRLFDMGKGPVVAEPVVARVSLRSDAPDRLRVHALDTLTGRRRQALQATVSRESITFELGPGNNTIYYEIAR